MIPFECNPLVNPTKCSHRLSSARKTRPLLSIPNQFVKSLNKFGSSIIVFTHYLTFLGLRGKATFGGAIALTVPASPIVYRGALGNDISTAGASGTTVSDNPNVRRIITLLHDDFLSVAIHNKRVA
jgi:hypothetical protein